MAVSKIPVIASTYTEITIPSANYWAAGSYYAKWGNMVTVSVIAKNASSSGLAICTLPEGYRPHQTVYGGGMGAGPVDDSVIVVGPDGTVILYPQRTTSGMVRASVTYVCA